MDSGVASGRIHADDARRAAAARHRERFRGVSGRVSSRETSTRQRRQKEAAQSMAHERRPLIRRKAMPQIAVSESPDSAKLRRAQSEPRSRRRIRRAAAA
jgi:hypothetical protein